MHNQSQRSIQLNRFMFGVVLEQIRSQEIVLKFDTPNFKFRPSALKKESTRNLLKYLDFDYPRNEALEPLSYTKLSNQDMTRHIQWIERQVAYSGGELKYIADEWNRLIAQIR